MYLHLVKVIQETELIQGDVVSKEVHDELLAQFDQSQQEIAFLEHQLAELKRLIFGSRSERFIPTSPAQMSLFEGLEHKIEDLKKRTARSGEKQQQKQKPVRALLPAHLPREEEILEPEAVPTGSKRIGEEITEILEYHPGRLFVRRIIRVKYALPADGGIVIPELPCLPIPKGNAGASLLAHIQVSKWCDHLPYYRQIQIFKRSGVILSDSTINGWFNATCDLLQPLYDCLKKNLKKKVLVCDYLQADESPIKVQDSHKKGTTHTGYHWVYRAPVEKLVLFQYQPSRAREGPEHVLQYFSGTLQTDGYQVYNNLKTQGEITLSACLAHARRKFEHALDNDKARAEYVLGLIGQLYAIEREAKQNALGFDDRKKLRLKEAAPILDELENWLIENQNLLAPESPIGKAVSYTINLWSRLKRYIEDGRFEIDNNSIENAIRPLALGRKNYMFSGSHPAAQKAAMMYSFFATCKANQVEPYQWLKDVLERIPQHRANRLDDLLPISRS